MSHFHNAKIIATMGPAIDKETVLSKVVNDIDVFRINLSHGDEETKRKYIDIILKLDSSKSVMLDLRGPEIRTKNKFPITLSKWEKIQIHYSQQFQESSDHLLIDYPNLHRIPLGTIMSIDNDQAKIEVTAILDSGIEGNILIGWELAINKIVDFDNYIPKLPFLTEKDKEQIIRWIDNKINIISVGYIRTIENVIDIKAFLAEQGGKRVKVIAKIETAEALENFEQITEASDWIIISRSKLAILLHNDNDLVHEKKLAMIRSANMLGKPIIMTAGLSITGDDNKETIATLIEEVKYWLDAILLTKETAVWPEPLDTITMLYELINDVQYQPHTDFNLTDINTSEQMLVTDYIINQAYRAAKDLNIKAIICPTESGYTPARLSALKPNVPIISFMKNDEAYRYMNLLWWVKWYKVASTFDVANIKQMGKEMIRILFKGNISLDDQILIVHSQWHNWWNGALNGIELYKFKDI